MSIICDTAADRGDASEKNVSVDFISIATIQKRDSINRCFVSSFCFAVTKQILIYQLEKILNRCTSADLSNASNEQ